MRGMDVTLIIKEQTGTDAFGSPVYSETQEVISDCLVGQPSSEDLISTMELTGKHISYVIGIPKGDTHDWTNTDVIIVNPRTGVAERFRTIGEPMTGIQANIPLRWGANIKVEKYG